MSKLEIIAYRCCVVYNVNRTGPSTEPRGTNLSKSHQFAWIGAFFQTKRKPDISYKFESLSVNIAWSMV